jgi:hypothetical protein
MKKIREFLDDVKAQIVTEEGIRSFLLSLSNEEFIEMLSNKMDNDTEGKADIDIERMTQSHASVISEIIADLTLDEKEKALSNISNDFYTVEKMIYKTLPIDKATKLFLDNPNKYKEEIEAYIETPRQTEEKDKLIANILSDKNLYRVFSNETLNEFKEFISDGIVLLDETYDVINITDDEIKNEVARYLANIGKRKNDSVNRGILNKVNPDKLYSILIEVNRGLKNIDSPEITHEELINELEMSFYYAVEYLSYCMNYTDEEIRNILLKIYPEEQERIGNKTVDQLLLSIQEG